MEKASIPSDVANAMNVLKKYCDTFDYCDGCPFNDIEGEKCLIESTPLCYPLVFEKTSYFIKRRYE